MNLKCDILVSKSAFECSLVPLYATERMRELTATPESQLSLPEFCIMRIHQETATLREELGVVRIERDNSRDAAVGGCTAVTFSCFCCCFCCDDA